MNKTLKSLLICLCFFGLCCSSIFAQQQITKFGVVDTSKVYSAFYKNSAPIRNYESKKAEFSKEIAKRSDEIKALRKKKVEYDAQGDSENSKKTALEITRKTEYLTEYTNSKNSELEKMQSNLQKTDDFYKSLYKALAKVAEKGGYSMILSLQESQSILWYSTSVDVTQDVIKELGL